MVKLQPNYENRISANEICQQLSRNENPDNVLDFLFLVSYNCGQVWSKKCFLGGHLPQGSVRFWCFVKEGLYKSYILRRGVYYGKRKEYLLNFVFKETSEEEQELVSVFCEAVYEFVHIEKYEDIPLFFFANAFAILFPYIRAFVSTLTLQANYGPLVLSTMNLSSLAGVLKERTRIDDEA